MRKTLLILTTGLFVACVPMKQFRDMESQKKDAEQDLRQMTLKNEECSSRAKECEGSLKRANAKVDQLTTDTVRLYENLLAERQRIKDL